MTVLRLPSVTIAIIIKKMKNEIKVKKSPHAVALEKVPAEALAKAIRDALLKDKQKEK